MNTPVRAIRPNTNEAPIPLQFQVRIQKAFMSSRETRSCACQRSGLNCSCGIASRRFTRRLTINRVIANISNAPPIMLPPMIKRIIGDAASILSNKPSTINVSAFTGSAFTTSLICCTASAPLIGSTTFCGAATAKATSAAAVSLGTLFASDIGSTLAVMNLIDGIGRHVLPLI